VCPIWLNIFLILQNGLYTNQYVSLGQDSLGTGVRYKIFKRRK
jgi:hypothetical protein